MAKIFQVLVIRSLNLFCIHISMYIMWELIIKKGIHYDVLYGMKVLMPY